MPRSAEAKVVARDAPGQAVIDAARSGTGPNPALAELIQAILSLAEARPETTNVGFGRLPKNIVGQYNRETRDVTLHPMGSKPLDALSYRETLGHELLHFLKQFTLMDIRKDTAKKFYGVDFADERSEHQLINYILGGDPDKLSIQEGLEKQPFNIELLKGLGPKRREYFYTVLSNMFGESAIGKQGAAPVAPQQPQGLLESIGALFGLFNPYPGVPNE